jgi:MFS family permease
MRSVGAIATIIALALAWGAKLVAPGLGYKPFFVLAGIAIVASAFLAPGLSKNATGGVRQPIVFRREYGLFYLLCFLEGCRRQIFGIFALFTLIAVYNTPVETVLLLRLIYSVLSAILAPKMGRMIDRLGERATLSYYAIGIIALFIGYAVIKNPLILYGLYVIDNVMFTFSAGISTFLNRIVRPGELTPSIAMGVTMNHVAAVSLPIAGALLWKQSGNYQLPFVLGVGLAVAALIATQKIPHNEAAL